MSNVAVSKKVLLWALERSELSEEDLSKKYPKIHHWIEGNKQPTLKQLESLATTTHTPFGFFFLKEPPEESLPVKYFRTYGNESHRKPSPDLLETVQTMQQRQVWMREFLIEQGQERLQYVNSAKINEQVISIAQRLRNILGFTEGWAAQHKTWTDALIVLRNAIQNAGILIVVNGIVGNNTHRKLNPKEFRGFVLVDEYAPLIFVNSSDGKAAQMFTLAHELAHVIFGSSAAFDLRELQPANNPTEQACNRVAAEFLVPGQEIRKAWPSIKKNDTPFQALARKFKVSEIVAARRALDLALINKETFLDFYNNYKSKERRTISKKTEGGDFYANQNLRLGKRFASAVIREVKEGRLLYSEAYKLTGLYGKTFDNYATLLKMEGV